MHGTVIFRMKGKCTLLKSALSRQVLDSNFETRSSITMTQDPIIKSLESQESSLEDRDTSDCQLIFEQYLTLVEPDICKTYAHAIDLLCWTMFQLCYVHYCLCINYVTYHIT